MNYHIVTNERAEKIWGMVLAHAGEIFTTAKGLPFTYHQKISRTGEPLGELVIDRKEKTITRNTVLLAYDKALELMESEGYVSGPKKLGVFGASYLYPVFLELGICRRALRACHRELPADSSDGDFEKFQSELGISLKYIKYSR